jgi:uncharacterized protein
MNAAGLINQRVLAPVRAEARLETLDVLRGFALLGILTVNIAIFSQPAQVIALPLDPATPLVDRVADWLIRFLAEAKFYSLFSFLFGLGFALQLQRAEAQGAGIGRVYVRRLLVLLGIGLIHAFLIWVGDVLTLYALLGFVLLAFRKARPRTLLIWAVIFWSLPILFNGGVTALIELARNAGPEVSTEIQKTLDEQEALYVADAERAAQVYAAGDYVAITQQRVQDILSFMFIGNLAMAPNVLAMFLLGLYFGRRRLFENVNDHLPLFRKLLVWGLILGVTGNLIFALLIQSLSRVQPSAPLFLATTGQAIGAPALMLAYMAALTLLNQRAEWQKRLRPLSFMGRLALSNYLSQSLICTLIFYGYGLGLLGQVGLAACLVLVLVIYAVQMLISAWWIKRFQFGPAEWVWRSLTYLRLQPMRRSDE